MLILILNILFFLLPLPLSDVDVESFSKSKIFKLQKSKNSNCEDFRNEIQKPENCKNESKTHENSNLVFLDLVFVEIEIEWIILRFDIT